MRLLVLTLLCSAISIPTVVAAQQSGQWLILPASAGDDDAPDLNRSIGRLRGSLTETGASVWEPSAAAKRFEAEASAPPAALTEAELSRWMSLSSGAVDDLAEGDNDAALEKLNAAQNMSRDAIEELNREPERARRVFDTCLYKVRAVLATESESRARSVARECRRLVPRAEPTRYMHPPAVTKLLSEIDSLQAKQSGELRVDSTPSGCPARLNGVLLGETPVSIGDVFPGEYRVQVECRPGERGRVHFVTVGAGRASRSVDVRFDGVVQSRPSLRLRYARSRDMAEHRVSDARSVARAVSASNLVLVSGEGDAMMLERIDARASQSVSPLARVRIAAGEKGPSDESLDRAAAALVAGECTDLSSEKPKPLECGRVAKAAPVVAANVDDRPWQRRPRGQFIAGMTLIGVGIAGLATGYALLIPRASAAEDWAATVDSDSANGLGDPSDTTAHQRWLDLRGGIIAAGAVGSAALVTAMPLALPEHAKTPWWAWVSGVAGLGLGAFSIAYGVTAEGEPDATCSAGTVDTAVVRSCINRGQQTSIALLTGLTAAPLITMPLVYLFRPSKAKLEPQVQIGRALAYVGLRGSF